MEIKTIGIIGAGRMGSGIAQVMAASGFDVILMDVKDEIIQKGVENIKKGLAKALEKGKITPEEKEKIRARIRTTTELEDMAKVDFIIEAVPEIAELKLDIFKRLDKICPKNIILSTNTSSIPISKIASATKRRDKVIGMHFMNPAPVMELVEVIRGINTSDETFETVKNLTEKIGKIPVESKDSPGFIVNRVLMPMINEAVFALMEGVASAEDIDKAMTLGANLPMGPLSLADLIGLDTVLSIMESIYRKTGDPKHRPCPLLKRYIDSGQLGKKTGRGFYKYGL
ncbi:MAG: 3-hydroxybutyryl-CoA dehydrogenase [Nitrospinae bacterium RIFCSPLOWO2_02_FULL_39_110]|nr:MAG: 3-hydroxybutyryl-CoA dehydrogenase [Nitrospinae bacterium RIFCSPHIGHO2_02_39_11]OGV98161.1 MAG: 3-hydroxybutyryl-CoA dehydrogenase [Nitrospinae bacterium RIFCSPHIGHO2_12_FULL_39_42]OGW01576.1 MAG: 3-hydroxybutyryl-CoA dehydrogenase [Nitrospinae bacterium RIFCSPHIGHO2_02_FULL_39_82]OGW04548.1 MAG: 3-hydroxybutyryl-CoA dehydrogenase [Nitrospinae bacterium RIFCSPLOWO2_02_FULL_39_110]OGW06873.1 MAG: 3-hydroxybutyryl-CoA dehydrogenase [Nitrospinae bacterium RIFCSPLOWO2_02_39_17]OGW07513.1 M